MCNGGAEIMETTSKPSAHAACAAHSAPAVCRGARRQAWGAEGIRGGATAAGGLMHTAGSSACPACTWHGVASALLHCRMCRWIALRLRPAGEHTFRCTAAECLHPFTASLPPWQVQSLSSLSLSAPAALLLSCLCRWNRCIVARLKCTCNLKREGKFLKRQIVCDELRLRAAAGLHFCPSPSAAHHRAMLPACHQRLHNLTDVSNCANNAPTPALQP